MFLLLYKALMTPAAPFLDLYLKRRMRRGKEDPVRAGERRGQPARTRSPGFLIWAHAASVGESLSLLSVIREILQTHPTVSILVTTGTVTSARLMGERLPPGAFHHYVPVDHPRWVGRFLDHWRPDLVLWTESEFWPHLLQGVKKRKIPAVLLNARMSAASFARWSKIKGTARQLLGAFTFCLAQNKAEAVRLRGLGLRDVRVAGNLKYAAAPLPADPAEQERLVKALDGAPRILWASTHPGEEAMAFRLHQKLLRDHPDFLTMIVPRHPARGAEIETLLRDMGADKISRRAGGGRLGPESGIYIADTLGELGMFFRLAPLSVMGGSFENHGGHNPIEPAQLGSVTFFGPSRRNFLTIFDELSAADAMIPVGSEEELYDAVTKALTDKDRIARMADNAMRFTAGKAHVVDDVMQAIAPLLPPGETSGETP